MLGIELVTVYFLPDAPWELLLHISPILSTFVKLSQHIGQGVRVTGTMASAASSSPDKIPSAANSGQAAGQSDD